MVGSRMMNIISERFEQIRGDNRDCGGVIMKSVGDLFQLKPVMDNWTFQDATTGYEVLAPTAKNHAPK